MEIKAEKQLKKGEIIKWILDDMSVIDLDEYSKTHDPKIGAVDLEVIQSYKHFVQFKILHAPFLPICITNNELYQKGIYKTEDFIREFAK